MAGVNKYKDGVVSRLYKGLQGLVKQPQDHLRRGRGTPRRRPTPSRSTGHRYRAATSCSRPARTPARCPGLEIDGDRIIASDHALQLTEVPKSGDRARRRRHRRRVRQRLALLRRRGHDRRGPAASRARRGRGVLEGDRAGVPQARDQVLRRACGSPGVERSAPVSPSPPRTASRSRPTSCSSRSAVGPTPPAWGSRSSASAWSGASSSPTSGCGPTFPASSPSGTSFPGSSSPTAASSRASCG